MVEKISRRKFLKCAAAVAAGIAAPSLFPDDLWAKNNRLINVEGPYSLDQNYDFYFRERTYKRDLLTRYVPGLEWKPLWTPLQPIANYLLSGVAGAISFAADTLNGDLVNRWDIINKDDSVPTIPLQVTLYREPRNDREFVYICTNVRYPEKKYYVRATWDPIKETLCDKLVIYSKNFSTAAKEEPPNGYPCVISMKFGKQPVMKGYPRRLPKGTITTNPELAQEARIIEKSLFAAIPYETVVVPNKIQSDTDMEGSKYSRLVIVDGAPDREMFQNITPSVNFFRYNRDNTKVDLRITPTNSAMGDLVILNFPTKDLNGPAGIVQRQIGAVLDRDPRWKASELAPLDLMPNEQLEFIEFNEKMMRSYRDEAVRMVYNHLKTINDYTLGSPPPDPAGDEYYRKKNQENLDRGDPRKRLGQIVKRFVTHFTC